jgi:hypothetical protein
MSDGVGRADVFTASAEHNAFVWVYHSFLFTIFLFKFEGSHVAEIDAFTAGNTFFIVYLWVPRYFFSGNSLVCFFRNFCHFLTFKLEIKLNLTIFKYCY